MEVGAAKASLGKLLAQPPNLCAPADVPARDVPAQMRHRIAAGREQPGETAVGPNKRIKLTASIVG